MSASARDWPRSIAVDSGVFAAAINAAEPHHAWARRMLATIPGSFLTCEACVTEAVHILENAAPAIDGLGRLLSRMTILSFAEASWRTALGDVVRMSPQMDYADACIVHIVRHRRDAFALTLDHRDFATYRIPFASPRGEFYL